ncbi:cache domain-containing protein [Sphaerotilus sp.]|uniref:cache domain-containing protein n=1 Tax=Sphaerotilus sp. TaxID=2093942 RepID=UPI00286E2F59|nr:cache domain-containing protein [Sphaerotilus sp.]
MRIKLKVMLLAMIPLIASGGLIVMAQHQQEQLLAQRQEALVRKAYIESARADLRHFAALALSTLSPLYNTGRDDEEIKQQAMRQLAALDYGSDGYFFLYDFDGVNLMHPRQPGLVGRNLLKLKDEFGGYPILAMRDIARTGGGFVDYSWNKPSTQDLAAKIAYVTPLPRWNWWFGTGVYVDDIDRIVADLNHELAASTASTMRWIGLIMGGGLLLIFGGGLWLSLHELRMADAKLTLMARQVVGSQEAERAHLSRELHDGTSQTLVSIKLLTEAAMDRLPPEQTITRAALGRAVDRLTAALTEVRGMSHRLRPVMLDTLGLSAALGQLADEMWAHSDTRSTVVVEGEPFELPDDIKTVLFRVTQEALTNIQKHAGASRVALDLVFSKGGLLLRVQDNGVGFDTEAVLRHPSQGIGLRNMRERLASIDGRLHVQSRPGATVVLAEVPEAAIRRFASV